ncbi:hypothetical protein [Arthrobacter sp. FW306-07-I]|uniref:hypothetical protein n=1 Tax=Arthrobacter sp. FW306-07-I TaxID=2879622 RepID=UPI001F27AE24|nr:hypothetical protein [Arthrobacter sp. FW306-07-I]UKA76176.1 hypothetical protein LFT46_03705 [Arthrobacter sp. FW306-07-I]
MDGNSNSGDKRSCERPPGEGHCGSNENVVMGDPRQAALDMVQRDEIDIFTIWLRYFAYGGDADELDFEAGIYGLLGLDEYDALILSWVVEELSAQ